MADVLVVEDKESLRTMLRHALERPEPIVSGQPYVTEFEVAGDDPNSLVCIIKTDDSPKPVTGKLRRVA